LRDVVAAVGALSLAVAGYAETLPACASLPGASALWFRPGLRFVLVGEMHGTAETPVIFRDLVCAATSNQRPIVVGIERSTREQPAIDAFMAPGNHDAATSALLTEKGWIEDAPPPPACSKN
jgi:hypothetical protein